MIKRHGSLFRWVVALAMVLSLVVGVLPAAPPAEANYEAWSASGMPTVINMGAIGPIVVAGDGTMFVVTNFGNAADLVRSSTNGGASWSTTTAIDPDGGATAIIDIVVSPSYSTDRTVLALGANQIVYMSRDSGLTWGAGTQPNTTAAAFATAANQLAVAPNFNAATSGLIAVGGDDAGTLNQAKTNLFTGGVTNTWGGWANLPLTTTAGNAADRGMVAIAFSPNYISDGTIMGVYHDTATPRMAETRSINGAAFGQIGTTTAIWVPISADADNVAVTARIAFPSGYNIASADNFFVAINDTAAAGSDAGSVFRRVAGAWVNTNPPDDAATNTDDVTSIVASGSFSSAVIFVAANGTGVPVVRKSTDGGVTWVTPLTPARMGGTVASPTFLALSTNFATDNTVYAGTGGNNGGFFRSASGGGTTASWEGLALYLNNYDTITGLAISPNFATDATAWIVQHAATVGNAVFRTTSGRTGTAPGASASWRKTDWGAVLAAAPSSVSVSPGFATDSTVYIADAASGIAKSTNGGQTFSTAFITAIPSGTIIAGRGVVAASGTTVFVLASGGRVHRSTDSGQTWTTYSSGLNNVDTLAVSPNFTSDSTLLLGGRNSTNGAVVQKSADGGVTWSNVGTHPDTNVSTAGVVVTVAFDSDYASAVTSTAKYIYSGTDNDVYRFQVDTDTSWRDMDAGANTAPGFAPVAPGGATVVTGVASRNGLLYITTTTVGDGVRRALTPKGTYDGTATTWLNLGWVGRGGPPNITEAGTGKLDQNAAATVFTNVGQFAVGSTSTGVILVAGDNIATDIIRIYDDNLITAPTLLSPATGAALTAHPGANPPSNVQWSSYGPNVPGVQYQVELSTSADFSDQVNTALTGAAATVTAALNGLGITFTAGNTYYWRARAQSNAGADVVSPWSETRNYGAAAGNAWLQYPSSAPGARLEVPSNTPTFQWTNVASATGYEFQIASEGNTATYSGYPGTGNGYMTPLLTATVSDVTLSMQPGVLQAGGVYYWHVRPIFGAIPGAWSYLVNPAVAVGSGVFKVVGEMATPTAIPPTATPTAVPGAPTATPAAPTATPAPVSAATQLATISTNLVLAISYNPSDTTDPWKIYDPAAPEFANDLLQLSAGSGYWIYVSAASTLVSGGNTYNLVPGWNLIGWLG